MLFGKLYIHVHNLFFIDFPNVVMPEVKNELVAVTAIRD